MFIGIRETKLTCSSIRHQFNQPPTTGSMQCGLAHFGPKRFHVEHSSAQNLETFPRRAFTLDVETFPETFPRRHDLGSTGSTWKRFENVSTSRPLSLTSFGDPKAAVFREWHPETFPRRPGRKKTFPRRAVFCVFARALEKVGQTFPRRPFFGLGNFQ